MLSMLTLLALTMPNIASASLCDDISEGTGGFFSCGTETTSFTEFTGQLATPDASQYAPGLTQNQDLREFIKNVVNFALGFLGIIAVVVVIYGGFMYVTAAGNEDQAGKGKKAITYAVIGIIIILSSFALVNTVLLAGGGTDQGGGGASAPEATGDQNARRQALFAYAGTVVQTVARDFVTAYQNYSEIKVDLASLKNTDVFQQISDGGSFKTNLQQKRTILQNIISKSGPLSQVAEKGQDGLLVIDTYINLSNAALENVAEDKETTDSVEEWFKNLGTNYDNMKSDFDAQFGEPGMEAANKRDFAQAVAKANDSLLKLQRQIKQAANLPAVDAQFEVVLSQFRTMVSGLPTTAYAKPADFMRFFMNVAFAQDVNLTLAKEVDNATVLQIVNDLSKLYDLVKDLQFVYTVITSDKTEGNAPLPVNFDGLKSLDPNNKTIPDSNYTWDFGDLGAPDNTATGPAATHVYKKPGTYIVRLDIKAPTADTAKGEVQPADGIAYQTVTVKPAIAQINLAAQIPGQDPYYLSQYQNGVQITDIQDLPVTLTEAKSGIVFNASETRVGAKGEMALTDSKLKNTQAKIKWDFGDRTNPANVQEGPPDTLATTQPVTYNAEGTYRVTLEVTDDRGVTDRKIFNVIVKSLVARVRATPGQFGELGQEFSFQSISASDTGAITSYQWDLKKGGAAAADFVDSKTDALKYIFKEPGQYALNLEVGNGLDNATLTSPLDVQIKSKPPVAQFKHSNTDPTHPNVYVFDGRASYDPDGTPGQAILYKWEVNSAPGDCTYYKQTTDGKGFEKTGKDCTDLGSEGDKGYSAANGRLKFKLKKGQYTVTLDVQDPSDPNNSVPQEQDVLVENDLDVGWSDDGKPLTAQLVDGAAEVTFNVASENGVAYQIDTGDGEKEDGNITGGTASVKHTYTQAGAFKARLTAFDAQDNGNATYRKVFVGSSDTPIAAIGVNKDGEDVADTTAKIEGTRTTTFVFDANKALNIDGTGRNLNYSWDFGDGTEKSTRKEVTHTFKEIGDKQSMDFTVKLKVSNIDDGKSSPEDTVTVTIKREPPVVNGLTALPIGTGLTTPVQVSVAAQGAVDPDGRIASYRWWYYDVNDPETQLGVQITQSPNATLTVGTNGEEAQKKVYKFGVIVTDNENDKFDSSKDLNDALIPSLEVTNGPNKAPLARFNVDRTNIFVGESVNFSSSSSDPDADGKIEHYMWNFEGTYTDPGNKDYDKANVTYTFKNPARDGVKVRLKVRDNNGAESTSDPVTIFVDSKAGPPTAAFTSSQTAGTKSIKFTNNSTADTAAGAKIQTSSWDFDVASDANGDGKNDNDIQSGDANPTFAYPEFGIYRAKLTVTDDMGNSAFVTNFVNVKAPAPAQTQQVSTEPLDARLTTNPAASVGDGRVHLQGDTANVTLDFSGSTGPIKTYIIDKNILFDSNGNGVKEDDEDYKTDKAGSWTTPFARSYGAIRVRLTVVDTAGKKDFVDKDIVFDPLPTPPAATISPSGTTGTSTSGSPGTPPKNQLSAFVLAGYEVVDWQVLLVSLAGFGIFIASTLNKKKHANKSK